MNEDMDQKLLKFVGDLKRIIPGTSFSNKIDKAIKMFKKNKNILYIQRNDDSLTAVTISQSTSSREYAVKIKKDGSFYCGTQNLRPCGGLRGTICKHIILTMIGAIKSGTATVKELNSWVKNSTDTQPQFLKNDASETLILYKMALDGEIEWRPIELLPEDFMAF